MTQVLAGKVALVTAASRGVVPGMQAKASGRPLADLQGGTGHSNFRGALR